MFKITAVATALIFSFIVGGSVPAQEMFDLEAYDIAREAYLYAYPIVTMDVSMRQATNAPVANSTPLRAPINQFAHARTYPRADAFGIVVSTALGTSRDMQLSS